MADYTKGKPLGITLQSANALQNVMTEEIGDGSYIPAGLFIKFGVGGLALANNEEVNLDDRIVGVTMPTITPNGKQDVNKMGIGCSVWVQCDPANPPVVGKASYIDNQGRLTSVTAGNPISCSVVESSATSKGLDFHTDTEYTGLALITDFVSITY